MHNKNLKIGENICNNFYFLKKLSKSKSELKRRRILRAATNSELLAIVESALNIVKGRFNISARQKSRIDPYKNYIRTLARIRSERGARRLVQKGNGIGAFAAFLTPVILEAIRHFKRK